MVNDMTEKCNDCKCDCHCNKEVCPTCANDVCGTCNCDKNVNENK